MANDFSRSARISYQRVLDSDSRVRFGGGRYAAELRQRRIARDAMRFRLLRRIGLRGREAENAPKDVRQPRQGCGATASAIRGRRGKSGSFARAILHRSVNKSTKKTPFVEPF
jgi:hypothetical protein